MKTTFSASRMQDSHCAHLAAQEQFYPLLFPDVPLTFEDTANTIKDMEYAVDCIVAIGLRQLRAPLRLSVQERWRTDLEAMSWGDITVTEWNLASDLPSELHKLGAQLFVYGFYDKVAGRIVAAAAVDVPRMVLALSLGKLSYRERRRGDQSFLGFGVSDLEAVGAVLLKKGR